MNFAEQIMSKDKYASIFSPPNGGCCIYYHSNLFCNMGSFENCFSWSIFSHVTRLDQSRASELKYLMDYK